VKHLLEDLDERTVRWVVLHDADVGRQGNDEWERKVNIAFASFNVLVQDPRDYNCSE
jgi:hypothetical protein